MGCIKFIVKHTLFIFNLVFTILGLIIIAGGSFFLYLVRHHDATNSKDVEEALKYLNFFLIGFIAFGSVIFLISFCGCCGSISEKKGLLIPYAVIMFILFCASLYLVISKDKFMDKIKTDVKTDWYKRFNSAKNPIDDKLINVIQFSLKCCGPEGPDFYKNTDILNKISASYKQPILNKFKIKGDDFISPSCCSTFDKDAFSKGDVLKYFEKDFKCRKEDVYETGCLTKVNEFVDKVGKYYIIVTISVAVVEILAMLLAVYMCVQISKQQWTSQKGRGYRA